MAFKLTLEEISQLEKEEKDIVSRKEKSVQNNIFTKRHRKYNIDQYAME